MQELINRLTSGYILPVERMYKLALTLGLEGLVNAEVGKKIILN